jgi:hypothetical protein
MIPLSKTMANMFEPFVVAFVTALTPIIRLLLPKAWNGKTAAAILLLAVCAFAIGIHLLVPPLPE